MDWFMIVLRLLHIVLGAFWVGSLIFISFYLMPSVQELGPDGGKVVQALTRRGIFSVLPVVAILTILAGLGLFWKVSHGHEKEWMASGTGMTLSLGAVAAIVAAFLGIVIARPAAMRAEALTQAAVQMPEGPARAAQLAEAQRLRARSFGITRLIALLLLATVTCMAVARYV